MSMLDNHKADISSVGQLIEIEQQRRLVRHVDYVGNVAAFGTKIYRILVRPCIHHSTNRASQAPNKHTRKSTFDDRVGHCVISNKYKIFISLVSAQWGRQLRSQLGSGLQSVDTGNGLQFERLLLGQTRSIMADGAPPSAAVSRRFLVATHAAAADGGGSESSLMIWNAFRMVEPISSILLEPTSR
jgi:hypothetical protein